MCQGYAFVSIYICICVCVSSKNMAVCVLLLKDLHENTLCSFFTEFIVRFLCWQALLERLIHGFLKLRILVRALYGIVGVSPNLLSMSMYVLTQSHMYRTSEPLNFLRPIHVATVSVFLEAFCDVPINC